MSDVKPLLDVPILGIDGPLFLMNPLREGLHPHPYVLGAATLTRLHEIRIVRHTTSETIVTKTEVESDAGTITTIQEIDTTIGGQEGMGVTGDKMYIASLSAWEKTLRRLAIHAYVLSYCLLANRDRGWLYWIIRNSTLLQWVLRRQALILIIAPHRDRVNDRDVRYR